MKKNMKKTISDFIDDEENEVAKKVILNKREGLIERVDKVFITEDGRQLLREHY